MNKILKFFLLICVVYTFKISTVMAADAPSDELQKAIQFINDGNTLEAKKLLIELKQGYPEDVRIYNNLSVIYASENDLYGARDVLEEAVRLEPDYQSALINLGAIYSEMAQRVYQKLGIEKDVAADVDTKIAKQETNEMLSDETDSIDDPMPENTIETAIVSWKIAWMAQDIDGYLSAYSNQFKPLKNKNKAVWKAKRKWAVSKPKWIEIDISNMDIQRDGNKAKAIFTQAYKSDRYKDNVKKQLDLVLENGEWKIIKERSYIIK